MSSKLEFVEYVCEQISGAGEIAYKRMFGEYGIYCNGKFFALICEDQLFVKITKAGRELIKDLEEEIPYEGGSPYFLIEELDDRELLGEFVRKTCDELPIPKPKKKKLKKQPSNEEDKDA